MNRIDKINKIDKIDKINKINKKVVLIKQLFRHRFY